VSAPVPAEPAQHDPARHDPAQHEPAQPTPRPPTRSGHRPVRIAIEWGAILVVAVVAAILIRGFVVEPFFIPSGSMEPTLQVNDRVLVNKLAYHFHSVHRGDIVVFKKPPNDDTPGIKDLVKRVIGLPGETISAQDGQININGHPLREPWLPRGVSTQDFGPTAIPKGEYFMMGDNRGDSADSRVFGPVSSKLFVGRAFIRVWPLSRLGWL
jgi:signal peptidase I